MPKVYTCLYDGKGTYDVMLFEDIDLFIAFNNLQKEKKSRRVLGSITIDDTRSIDKIAGEFAAKYHGQIMNDRKCVNISFPEWQKDFALSVYVQYFGARSVSLNPKNRE